MSTLEIDAAAADDDRYLIQWKLLCSCWYFRLTDALIELLPSNESSKQQTEALRWLLWLNVFNVYAESACIFTRRTLSGTCVHIVEAIVLAVSCRLMQLLRGNINSYWENYTRDLLQVVLMTRLRVAVIQTRHLHVGRRRRLTILALGKCARGECRRHVSTEMTRHRWSDQEVDHPCPEAHPEVDLPCREVLVDVAALLHAEAASRGVSRSGR